MKRLFLAVLVVLLLAAGLAAAIAYDAGYILIAFGNYTVETTAWIGLALLLVLLVAMYVLVALLHRGVRQGGLISRWRHERRARRGHQQTTRGLIALMEGNYRRAVKQLEEGAERSDAPLVNHLMAARASAELGDAAQTRLLLHRAEQSRPRGSVAVELTEAELQLRAGHLEGALATLGRARRQARRHPRVLALLKEVYIGLGDWFHLLELLPELRRHLDLPPAELTALERSARLHLLDEVAPKGAQALHEHWRHLPKAAKRDPVLIARCAHWLVEMGSEAEAEALLRAQLKRGWDGELVAWYGRVQGGDPQQQLTVAEQWLQTRGDDPVLLRCLGRLALRNQLWGKARDYFEASLRLEESPETCAELGRLLGRLGQHERAGRYFERGLFAAAPALPALPLPEHNRIA